MARCSARLASGSVPSDSLLRCILVFNVGESLFSTPPAAPLCVPLLLLFPMACLNAGSYSATGEGHCKQHFDRR